MSGTEKVETGTPLGRHGEKDLHELGPQTTLGRDGDPASLSIKGVKERAHLSKGLIHHAPHGTQGVISGDTVPKTGIRWTTCRSTGSSSTSAVDPR